MIVIPILLPDLVLAGAADGRFRKIQRQFGDVTIDDCLEGVEDLDVLGARHHCDRVAFGTGSGASANVREKGVD